MIQGPQNIPFAQSSDSQQVPPPYHFPDVTVNAFVWPANMKRVQAYCDQTFNLGSEEERGFVYRPAAMWPYATLLFLEYPIMISSNPLPQHFDEMPYSDRGIISQTEVFIAVPVIRYGTDPVTLITETTLEWALPFIVVGNPMSSVCGREMLGLGKLLADIKTREGRFPNSFHGTIKMPGWRSLEPGAQMDPKLKFVDVKTNPVLPTFRSSENQRRSLSTLFESREASWLIEEMGSLSNLVDDISLGMIPTTMRTVGLKQYRDAIDPTRAIYQSIVTCRAKYSNINTFRMYDEKDIDIEFNDVGSFNEILQVFLEVGDTPSGRKYPLTPVAGFQFKADIDYDQMRVIHSFAIDREGGLPPIPAQSDLVSSWARPWKGFFGPLTHPMRNVE
ncbi:hypothetical protein [Qipengyuania zhejiangensis]|uniref:hypothetical protein n=1 Tax=Qipengyuania zhejiangensis TaxID=3077782 RepID=UPI002D79E995|nr:hypothetical protein [Qipengyuania sp. Z2]